jgi:hypothetical protein
VEDMKRPSMPEKPTLNDIEAFVLENIVPLERKDLNGEKVLTKSACIDGRTEPKDSEGRVRIIGGDAGLLFSFSASLNEMGIQKENEEIVSALINAKKEIEGEDAKLYLHTDEHGKKEGAIGCGHAKIMSSSIEEHNGDGKYGISSSVAKDLFVKAWERPEAEHLVLEGEHNEAAVLFVYGAEMGQIANFSVNSLDSVKSISVFVVDEEATREYFELYISKMSELLKVNVLPEKALEHYKKQLGVSASLLAKSLDNYNVFINDSGEARVEKASETS